MRRRLRGWRVVAMAALRHPRLAARLALFFDREDLHGIASVIANQLSERNVRLLTLALLDREVVQLTCERDGFRWLVGTGDWIGESIYLDGRFSPREVDAVVGWLAGSGKPLIVEVGANIGTTTLPLARAGYRVVAIEPVPSTFAMLLRNVEANGFDAQVRCVNSAVAVAAENVDMWVTKDSGLSELVAGEHGPGFLLSGVAGKRRITVPSKGLDEMLVAEDIDDIALVWSDTQGCETYVIQTGTRLWAAKVPLYLEVEPRLLDLQGGLDAFIELVEDTFGRFLTRDALIAGYEPVTIDGFGAFARSITDPGAYSDALLLP